MLIHLFGKSHQESHLTITNEDSSTMEPCLEKLVLQKHLGDCTSLRHIDNIPHFFFFGVGARLVIELLDHRLDRFRTPL